MPEFPRKLPAIHDRTRRLHNEAGGLGDVFLQYLYAMALRHLEEQTDTIALLHKEPSIRTPLAQECLTMLWPAPPKSFDLSGRGAMEPLDPTFMQCRSCRFWTGQRSPAGECRRFPPVLSTVEEGEVLTSAQPVWPKTNDDDWCGEWEVVATHVMRRTP